MNIKRNTRFLLVLLLFQLVFIQSVNAIEPCEIEKTDLGYIVLNNDCFWNAPPIEIKDGIYYPQFPVDQDLPDLLPIDADVQHANNRLYVEIKTANAGVTDSNGFEITVTVTTSGAVNETHVISAIVNGIRAGDERRDHIGIVYPNGILEIGTNISLFMEVDTAGSAFYGDVSETNELNNSATDTCWIGDDDNCDEL